MDAGTAVIELGPHPNMTVEECLSQCARNHADYTDIIVVGYSAADGSVMLRSSHIDRANAAWMLHQALDQARGK